MLNIMSNYIIKETRKKSIQISLYIDFTSLLKLGLQLSVEQDHSANCTCHGTNVCCQWDNNHYLQIPRQLHECVKGEQLICIFQHTREDMPAQSYFILFREQHTNDLKSRCETSPCTELNVKWNLGQWVLALSLTDVFIHIFEA